LRDGTQLERRADVVEADELIVRTIQAALSIIAKQAVAEIAPGNEPGAGPL
jgi:hypothetical protein